MGKKLVVKKSAELDADASRVWEALTNPRITKRYFFNCEAISDWKVGGPVVFRTTAGGQDIVAVKGIVKEVKPNKALKHTCFTPEFENTPSKHTTVSYKLSSKKNVTKLSVTQGVFDDEETYRHTAANWDKLLDGLKATLESQE